MGSGVSKKGGSSEKLQSREKKTLLKTLSGHIGGINCMDISCNLLLTGSDDRTARLWDLATYECKVVLEGHSGYVSCCKLWHANFALTGSLDKTVRKWNTASGNCVLKLERHSGVVNKMLVYGDFLFTSSYDSTAVCWNLRNGEASRIYRGHTKSVLPLAYVEGSEHDPGGGADLDRNKDSLITGSMDRTARMWNIASGTSLRTFRGHKGEVLCLAVDLENKMLFTGSTDNTIRKWNLLTGGPLKVFKGHEGSVLCLQMHHRLLYSASVDATARCWVAEFGDTTRKYVGHDHMISDMKYHHGIVFTGSGDTAVRAFDAKSGTLKRTFKGHKYVVNCLMPYNDTLLSGSYDGNVKVWNIRDLIKDKVGGSSTTIGSSVMSSANHYGRRHSDNSLTESEVTIRNGNGRRARRDATVETTNETLQNDARLRRARKPRGGRVAPSSVRRNGNNNSIHVDGLDFGYITDRLQDILEGEDYWAGSSNQSSVTSLKESQDKARREITTASTNTSRDARTASDVVSSGSSRPQTNSRPDTRSLVKRESSDLLKKRPRTESNVLLPASLSNAINPDIALVDEEIRMVAMETSSNTSGYRTADNNSPTSPVATSHPSNNAEKPKSRQKSSVSFSPTVSMKENSGLWEKSTHRGSKIPTSVKSNRTPPAKTGSARNSKSSNSSNGSPNLTAQERKQLEQEILDMV